MAWGERSTDVLRGQVPERVGSLGGAAAVALLRERFGRVVLRLLGLVVMFAVSLLVAAAFVISAYFSKDSYRAQWHQKMTVVVDTPHGEKRGSSVISVNFARGNERLLRVTEGSGVRWDVKGEAVVVDLGEGRYLFALLKGGSSYLGNAGVNAYVFSSRRYAPGEIEAVKAVERAPRNAPKVLPREMYPLLVTFDDINDPKTVKKVDPDNLAATFGPGYRLKRITIEITDEPVTRGKVEKVLGWWKHVDNYWKELTPDQRDLFIAFEEK